MYHTKKSKLFPKPDWEQIYPYYENRPETCSQNNECRSIWDYLQSKIPKISLEQLINANTGLTSKEYSNILQRIYPYQVHCVSILIFKNGTSYATSSSSTKKMMGEYVPVMISLGYVDCESYQEYQKGLESYKKISQGVNTPGDLELYFSLVGGVVCHNVVVLINKDMYDLFGTFHSPNQHYRISEVMNHFFNAKESFQSEIFADNMKMQPLQNEESVKILGKTNMLCSLYSIAYILAREACDNHISVEKAFQHFNQKDPTEFLRLIGGIYYI